MRRLLQARGIVTGAAGTRPLPPITLDLARRLFYSSPLLRRVALLVLWPALRARTYDLAHLAFQPEEEAVGTVQRDEALLLHALVRTLRPRVAVEIGFLGGRTALNLLLALPADAHLYSFDISPEAETTARRAFRSWPNFTFRRCSQDEIGPEEVDFREIDLAFLDAAHQFDLNVRTWDRLKPMLSDDAVVLVHDTGTWNREHFRPVHVEGTRGADRNWISEHEYQHQPEERQFVNWLREADPEFAQLHLHSMRTLRHGITLLHRQPRLALGDALAAGSGSRRGADS